MLLREREKEEVLQSYEDITQQLAQQRIIAATLEQDFCQTKSAVAAQLIQIEHLTDSLSVSDTSVRTFEAELRMTAAERDAAQHSVGEMQRQLDSANTRCLLSQPVSQSECSTLVPRVQIDLYLRCR